MSDECSAPMERGQVAYEAFKAATCKEAFIIPWEMLPPPTQVGWNAAAEAVLAVIQTSPSEVPK